MVKTLILSLFLTSCATQADGSLIACSTNSLEAWQSLQKHASELCFAKGTLFFSIRYLEFGKCQLGSEVRGVVYCEK